MKTIHVFLVMAFLVAVFILPGAVVNAQPNVPTITVDTLCDLSKVVQGEASGAFFLPDGNIIALKGDTPYIIDSKTGVILRTLESCNSETAGIPKVSSDGKRLVATKMGPKLVIWDVPTGKILTNLENVNGYCFSPDGSKLYICGGNSSGLGAIRVLDMTTLAEIERFGSFPSGFQIDISSDGQTLALSIYKSPSSQSDKKTSQVILINLNDKKHYTIVETEESGFLSMKFSPDGKQITSQYNDSNGENYIYVYNIKTNEKKIITEESLETIFGYKSLLSGHPKFIDNNILSFIFSKYTLIWNLEENQLKKLIEFLPWSISSFNDTLVLCNQRGVIGYLNKNIVSVKDNLVSNESYLTFNNNQLEYYSDKALIGETMVYDITGKLIANFGSQQFVNGKNLIQVNQTLPVGVYIFTINSGLDQYSYKFVVE